MGSIMETLNINIRLDGDSFRYPFSSREITGTTNQIASSSNTVLKGVSVTKISSEDCTIKQTNSDIDNEQQKQKRLLGASEDCTIKQTNFDIDNEQQKRKKLSGAQRRKRRRARNAIKNLQQSKDTSMLTEMGPLSDVNKTLVSMASASFSERPSSSNVRNEFSSNRSIQQSQYTSNPTEMGLLSSDDKMLVSMPSASFTERPSSSNVRNKFHNNRSIQQSQYTSNLTEMGLLSSDDKTLISMASASFSERPSSSNVRNEFSNNRSIQQSQYPSNLTEMGLLSSYDKTLVSKASAYFSERSSSSTILTKDCTIEQTSSNTDNQQLEQKKLSKSQKRKMRNAEKAIKNLQQSKDTSNLTEMVNTSFSNKCISLKKPANLSGPNSEPLPSLKMAIVKSNFPAFEIMPEEVRLIQNEILNQIDETPKGESLPLLNDFNLINGSLIYTCENQFTCNWLRKALDGYVFRNGTVLKVIQEKDLPQSIKMAFWTSDLLTIDTYKLLLRLKNYNPELKIENWIILEKKIDFQGQHLIILVDIDSFKAISKANYKAYTGVDQGIFSVLQSN